MKKIIKNKSQTSSNTRKYKIQLQLPKRIQIQIQKIGPKSEKVIKTQVLFLVPVKLPKLAHRYNNNIVLNATYGNVKIQRQLYIPNISWFSYLFRTQCDVPRNTKNQKYNYSKRGGQQTNRHSNKKNKSKKCKNKN